MRSYLNLTIVLVGIASVSAALGEFVRSEIVQSPTQRDVIVVDYCMSEGCPEPTKAVLYALPLDPQAGKPITVGSRYVWSHDGQRFATYEWKKKAPAVTLELGSVDLGPTIVLYDREGRRMPFPGYGTSPIFAAADEILYYSELDDSGVTTGPRLVRYNLQTATRTTVFEFDDAYTFWPEQVDCLAWPTSPEGTWGGYRGVIYKKDRLDEPYTFVVPWDPTPRGPWRGKKLILWKGDLTPRRDWPKEDPTLVVN